MRGGKRGRRYCTPVSKWPTVERVEQGELSYNQAQDRYGIY